MDTLARPANPRMPWPGNTGISYRPSASATNSTECLVCRRLSDSRRCGLVSYAKYWRMPRTGFPVVSSIARPRTRTPGRERNVPHQWGCRCGRRSRSRPLRDAAIPQGRDNEQAVGPERQSFQPVFALCIGDCSRKLLGRLHADAGDRSTCFRVGHASCDRHRRSADESEFVGVIGECHDSVWRTRLFETERDDLSQVRVRTSCCVKFRCPGALMRTSAIRSRPTPLSVNQPSASVWTAETTRGRVPENRFPCMVTLVAGVDPIPPRPIEVHPMCPRAISRICRIVVAAE